MTQEIPKLDLLIKLVGMTGSSHDNEALSAIRKANSLIRDSGWTWDRILRGKITIAADPFSGIAAPPIREANGGMTPGPTSAPSYTPTYSAPPRARPQPQPHPAQSTYYSMPNRYMDSCYCCGALVGVAAGRTFKRNVQWKVACTSCDTRMANGSMPIPSKAAKKQAPSVNDLAAALK